jgi:hypothetical protein
MFTLTKIQHMKYEKHYEPIQEYGTMGPNNINGEVQRGNTYKSVCMSGHLVRQFAVLQGTHGKGRGKRKH